MIFAPQPAARWPLPALPPAAIDGPCATALCSPKLGDLLTLVIFPSCSSSLSTSRSVRSPSPLGPALASLFRLFDLLTPLYRFIYVSWLQYAYKTRQHRCTPTPPSQVSGIKAVPLGLLLCNLTQAQSINLPFHWVSLLHDSRARHRPRRRTPSPTAPAPIPPLLSHKTHWGSIYRLFECACALLAPRGCSARPPISPASVSHPSRSGRPYAPHPGLPIANLHRHEPEPHDRAHGVRYHARCYPFSCSSHLASSSSDTLPLPQRPFTVGHPPPFCLRHGLTSFGVRCGLAASSPSC
ncbi:hypothetical protein B0H13DRAFT_2670507 [Mycena leptocephala]|nr:hypothetical protein B0H13DRAFT_2670507 [Mycena leptocephala]